MKRSIPALVALILAIPAHAAASSTTHVVDLLAGTTVDVCVNDDEVLSDATWNDAVHLRFPNGQSNTITLHAATPGTCAGPVLDEDTFTSRATLKDRWIVFPDRHGNPSLTWRGYDWHPTKPRRADVTWCHVAYAPRLTVFVDGERRFDISNVEDSYCWGIPLERGPHRIRLEEAATGDGVLPPWRHRFRAGWEHYVFFVTRPSGDLGIRLFTNEVGIKR